MTHALDLAHHLHQRCLLRGQVVDHLKLQKLVFYAYGAAVAHGCRAEVDGIAFSPWKHGPVNTEVWHYHKGAGANPLPPPAPSAPRYSPPLTQLFEDVVDVYGQLDSWKIRCESHLEAPWIRAWAAKAPTIPDAEIEAHFLQKYRLGQVHLPAYLGTAATAALDGIPPARFLSLHAMAEALRSRR